jgi:hypothetical protein
MRVTNGIPLGCPLSLLVHTVNCIKTLKDARDPGAVRDGRYVPQGRQRHV